MTSSFMNRLKSLDCHFNWDINGREIPKEIALTSLEDAIQGYNIYSRFPVRRFAMCLHAALIMFKTRKDDAYKKLMAAANRFLAYSKDPSTPLPPSNIPNHESPLWDLPCEEFFLECENFQSPAPEGGMLRVRYYFEIPNQFEEELGSPSPPAVEAEGTLPLWHEDRFSGIYTGAKYVASALEANMSYLEDLEESDVEGVISRTIPTSEMPASDRAFIRYVEAITWKLFGLQGKSIQSLERAILTDPNDVRWYLLTLEALSVIRANRNLDWGRILEQGSMETVVHVIDSLLDLKLTLWMADDLKFEKLQAINSVYSKSRRYNRELGEQCVDLSKSLVDQTSQPEVLAFCAQILSRRKYNTMDLALSTIENALANAVDHNRTYINIKASNIYKNAGLMEKALACAVSAASESFGAKWQVLDLKTRLQLEINPQEFFREAEVSCKHMIQVEVVHLEAFLYYICETNDIKRALLHFKMIMALAKNTPSRDVMGESYIQRLDKYINLAEAGYNVVCYALDGNHQDAGVEMSDEEVEMCVEVKEALEKDHSEQFGSRRKLNPKEYVHMLKSPKNSNKKPFASRSVFSASSGHTNQNNNGKSSGWGRSMVFGSGNTEKLSWRKEMRPPDDTTNPNVESPQNSTGTYQSSSVPCLRPDQQHQGFGGGRVGYTTFGNGSTEKLSWRREVRLPNAGELNRATNPYAEPPRNSPRPTQPSGVSDSNGSSGFSASSGHTNQNNSGKSSGWSRSMVFGSGNTEELSWRREVRLPNAGELNRAANPYAEPPQNALRSTQPFGASDSNCSN